MKTNIKFAVWLLIWSVITYFFIARYVVSSEIVKGESMSPTYHDGQIVIVNHLVMLWRNPVRGEVVVVYDTEIKANVIKRIDGIPGDLYGKNPLASCWYYILGDNPSVSVDSRFYGPVLRRNIVGVVE